MIKKYPVITLKMIFFTNEFSKLYYTYGLKKKKNGKTKKYAQNIINSQNIQHKLLIFFFVVLWYEFLAYRAINRIPTK